MKKTEIVILILTITIIGIFSIQEIHVQALTPPCIAPEDPDTTRQDFLKFSNAIISDWELIDIEIECNGTIVANYEISEFSSEETSYEVSVNIGYEDFRHSPQALEDLLKNKNPIVSNGISQLHSSDLFKEINEKLMIQTVSFDYHLWVTINSPMKFLVTAKNQYGYSSSFSIDPIRDNFGFLRLTNDVDIESFGVHEARKQVEILLTNKNSTCQIMSCTESSCGTTKVDEKYNGYSVTIQIEGELCPPLIRVSLDTNLKLSQIYPVDKYNSERIEWPLLIESKFDPPLKQVKNNINPENVICNKDLQIIFKVSDGSPACVKPKTAKKLIERGWALETSSIGSFEKCVAAGNPVMESYPRQCRTPDGKHFVEEINNNSSENDMLENLNPLQDCSRVPGEQIACPADLICLEHLSGGLGPPGTLIPIESIGGDKKCHKECFTDNDCPQNAPICLGKERATEDYVEGFMLCFTNEVGLKEREDIYESCLETNGPKVQQALEQDGNVVESGDPPEKYELDYVGGLVSFSGYHVKNMHLNLEKILIDEYELNILREGGIGTHSYVVSLSEGEELETLCTLELDNRIREARVAVDFKRMPNSSG